MAGVTWIMLLLALSGINGMTKEEWKKRTIYQVLTDRFARTDGDKTACKNLHKYCGGTFKGIANNLDYIKGMGFDAIWISPVVDNVGEGYHGYHARDWYKINEHFGTSQELKDLVTKCHEKGIAVMLDVVANHVGMVGVDYSTIHPFNQSEHYHDYCRIQDEDWGHNQWKIENCRLADLPDLKQENPYVEQKLLEWVSDIVKNYNIDGLRIDTVPEVPIWFWKKYSKAANVFTMGEVFDNRGNYIHQYIGALDSALNYQMFEMIRSTFHKRTCFNHLRKSVDATLNTFGDNIHYLGTFISNHDNRRFLNESGEEERIKGALVFTFFFPGIPIFYYGDEQLYRGGNDPANREDLWSHMSSEGGIYKFVAKLVETRKKHEVWNYPYLVLFVEHSNFVFLRGNVLLAFTSVPGEKCKLSVGVPFKDGTEFSEIFSSEKMVVTKGKVEIHLASTSFKVFEISSKSGNFFRE